MARINIIKGLTIFTHNPTHFFEDLLVILALLYDMYLFEMPAEKPTKERLN